MHTLRIPVICLVTLAAAACGKWSADEQRQVDAFRTSIVTVEEVSRGQASGLALSPEELTRTSAALQEALDAANSVTDPVLEQLHPDLPNRYRRFFVPALQMRLTALETVRGGAPITARELEWQVLMAEWGEWYDRALPTLRQNMAD